MTVENRRALVGRLIEREAAAGRAIARDADFMMLAALWIDGEIDVPEMRRRYQIIRNTRLGKKKLSSTSSQSPATFEVVSDESAYFFDRTDV
ncbi:hypothetical protein QO002_005779 [Pararhizobium capsulatum DSM 1112]|uniref:Uncharacterized protein n=1 Tax=Pararhizobium capsulatum DSM 1112 TaxID=1121113 RepID=A0ABU0C083_9HYPH|nr:hypothetical protein [Pararhizobium capsulatum]MDQ0323573.1 hypothetical protein [Pararhizobium capsulatum DSM 1112]